MGIETFTPFSYPLTCLSTALPSSPVAGQRVYVTDLGQEWLFNGSAWVVWVAGPTDATWSTVTTFTNGWVTQYAQPPTYRRFGGFVVIRGYVVSGTVGTVAFTLPVGFRPITGTWEMVGPVINTTFSLVGFQPDGGVIIRAAGAVSVSTVFPIL